MAWLTDKETSLTEQFKSNPLNWALVALLAYMLSSFLSSSKPTKPVAMHPDTAVFRNYTPRDLQRYDGRQDGGTGRILMAVSGNVYDVSRGRNFYGPGGPYGNFAGHDASRGLAKGSFDKDMLADPEGPIDKLEDLTADEWESLREWEQHFMGKYLLVGKFVENDG